MVYQFSHSVVSDPLLPMNRSTPGLPVHHQPPEFTQTHIHRVGDAIQHHSLTPSSPYDHNLPQHQGLFQWVGCSHQLTKIWSFSFSISLSSEYSGLIFFRANWFDLLAVQGTLQDLLQRHNSKASVLQHSAFFMVQLPHPCMTTRKMILSEWHTVLWLRDPWVWLI